MNEDDQSFAGIGQPPTEKGEKCNKPYYCDFQENKRRVFAIVMLVADEKAQADLDAITSSIQIEK